MIVSPSCKCVILHITTRHKLFSGIFVKKKELNFFLIEHFVKKLSNFIRFLRSFISNSFRIRSCLDLEWFFPDSVPAKTFQSDRLWLRIYNIGYN
jgi:hypothetical protein